MTHNVFNDDDGIVHEQPQRDDECIKRQSVDGKAGNPHDAQRYGQNQGHRHRHNHGRPPPEEKERHGHHRNKRNPQMLDQRIDGTVGFYAVVSRHLKADPFGNDAALHTFKPFQSRITEHHGVGTLALGNRQRHGLVFRLVRCVVVRIGLTIGKAGRRRPRHRSSVRDRRHIRQMHGAARGAHAHDEML